MRSTVVIKTVVISGLILLVVLAGFSREAHADMGTFSIEGIVGFGTGPEDDLTGIDFGTAIGGGAGAGFELIDNLQLRVDVSFFQWSEEETAVFSDPILGTFSATLEQELQNIVIFFGGRYFISIAPKVRPYLELGLSANLLEEDDTISISGIGSAGFSESETKIGVVPGGGVEVMVTSSLGVGAGIRYHLIGEDIGDFEGIDPSFFNVFAFASLHIF